MIWNIEELKEQAEIGDLDLFIYIRDVLDCNIFENESKARAINILINLIWLIADYENGNEELKFYYDLYYGSYYIYSLKEIILKDVLGKETFEKLYE